jgi:UDP-3-O-[3-hydroxymyristoyl] N-acetylglucosamine deacetylase
MGYTFTMAGLLTLAREEVLDGIGVHSGTPVRLRLKPSESGVVLFRRLDLGRAAALDPRRMEVRSSSCFRDGDFEVRTIEHLLAALYASGIGSVEVELTAAEVPILDGSAAPFVRALAEAGTRALDRPWEPIRVLEPQVLRAGEASLGWEPHPGFKISYRIDYAHPAIGRQEISLEIDSASFAREVAPARTFGFVRDLEAFRKIGLGLGSSLENTIGLDEEKVVNPPLRFPDEFVRHKVLDLVGDLAQLGRPVQGHFKAERAGHALHQRAVRCLLDRPA